MDARDAVPLRALQHRNPPSTDEVFTRRVLITLALSSAFLLAGLTFWAAPEVPLLAFAGVLVALLLRWAADLVARATGLSATWSLVLVVALLLVTLGLGGWLLGAIVARQFDSFAESLSQSFRELTTLVRSQPWGRRLFSSTNAPDSAGVLNGVAGALSTTLGAITNLVVIFFVGVYGAADPALYRRGTLRLVPRHLRPRLAEVLDSTAATLRRWLLGRLVDMILVGVLTTLGLWLLGVPYAPVLGLLAFALDFVPYVGPIIAALPAALVASTEGTQAVLYVALLYMAVQSIEGYLIDPLVQREATSLPPVITILAQVLLGLLVGGLGLALASPLAAAAIVVVRKLYVEDILGDPDQDTESVASRRDTPSALSPEPDRY